MHKVSAVPHDVPPRAMTRTVSMLKGCILMVEDDPAIATVVEGAAKATPTAG